MLSPFVVIRFVMDIIQEAMEKVAKYRERIVILKDDRRAKKALVSMT